MSINEHEGDQKGYRRLIPSRRGLFLSRRPRLSTPSGLTLATINVHGDKHLSSHGRQNGRVDRREYGGEYRGLSVHISGGEKSKQSTLVDCPNRMLTRQSKQG